MAKTAKITKADGWLVTGLDSWAKMLDKCGAAIPARFLRESTEQLIEPAVFGSEERNAYGGNFLVRLFSLYGSVLYDVLRATGPTDEFDNLVTFEVSAKSGNTSGVVRVPFEGSPGKLKNKKGRPWLRSGKDGTERKNHINVGIDTNRSLYEVQLVGLGALGPGVYAGIAENRKGEVLFHILVAKSD